MPGSLGTARYNRFVGFLVDARKKSGLTQEQVALKLRKPQSFVAKYERGERRIDVVEFVDICAAIDVKSADILGKL